MLLGKEYCCCAIPLINAGIYLALTEQLVAAATAGILALVTPQIVGAAVPSVTPDIFAVLCFVAAALQLLGFWGVSRESATVFKRYTSLHMLITIAIFAFSIVFIIVSATRHSTAQANCVKNFFQTTTTASSSITGADSEGVLLCNIFSWIGVGTMGGLWLVLAIFQGYLFLIVSSYGTNQRADHSKYYSLYSLNSYPGPGGDTTNIGMQNMNTDAWDSRASMDAVGVGAYGAEKTYIDGKGPSPSEYPPPMHNQNNPQRHPSSDAFNPPMQRTMSPPQQGYSGHNAYGNYQQQQYYGQ